MCCCSALRRSVEDERGKPPLASEDAEEEFHLHTIPEAIVRRVAVNEAQEGNMLLHEQERKDRWEAVVWRSTHAMQQWLQQYKLHPFKRQPVVTRFSTFKGRRRHKEGGGSGRRRCQDWQPILLSNLSSLQYILVLFLLIIVHHVPFTTQKGSSPSVQASSSSSITSSSPPRLIFANRRDIRIIDFYFRGSSSNIRGNTTIVVGELSDATALDIYHKAGVVCWSDIQKEKIECSSFNVTATQNAVPPLPFTNNKKTTIVSVGVEAPEDIICDFVTGNLYWTDSQMNRLEVASIYPPFYRKVLIWDDIDQPRALALAPNLGYLFWSDWGEHPKIERASMDGSLRKVIVDKDVFWPNGIALDLFQQHLYWADAKLHYIGRVDFEGGGREIINKGAPHHPFSLVYSSGYLFWSDWKTNSLHVMRSDGSHWKTLTHKQPLQPMDLAVFSDQHYPPPVWTGRYAVNPCASAGCSHLCLLHSAQPFFKCACPIGIKLLPNSTSRCAPEMENFLIVARGADIRRISLDTEDYTDITIPLTAIKHVLAVDYHVESGYVYWTDDEATRIKRAKLDGSNQQIVVKHEIMHPDGLVVDWVAQNLYWTDAGTDRIEVSRLDGTFRKILISRGLQEPRAISVDPAKGFLFWSDWGKKAKIERSLLDGSEREVIVNEEIYWPNGVALDLRAEKIYWSDAKADKIEVCGYDGSGRRVILQDTILLPHIFGIALLGDHIYWTDWQRRVLERADKNTGLNRMTIKEPFTDPMGLKGVNVADTQMWNISNPCKGNNGGCEHLCFFKPNFPPKNYTCACSSGYELSTDGRSCTIPDAFLVFSRDGDLHRISLNRTASTNMDDVIPVSKVKAASALDFDTVDSRIYWSDTKIKAIFRAFMNGSDTEKVIEFGVTTPEGIAVDWLSRNIYWTDMGRNRIEVAKLNGDHRRTVMWLDVYSPKSITLHPSKGWMYYALWNTSNPTIERAALDGSRRTTFVNNVGRANGLTIDLEENYLYWTDIDALIIERCNLDDPQKTRHVVQGARNGFKPFSLAQYEEYIYWSEMTSQTIQRAHKTVSVFHDGSGQERPQRLAAAQNVIDMAIYHKLKQVGWNPCAVSNCSHLCFSTPGGNGNRGGTVAQCGCPTHYTLLSDEGYCMPPREYLLYSSGATVSRLILDTLDCPDAVMMGGQSQKLRGISAVAWDGHSRSIYWIDSKTQDIKKAAENGGGATTLLNYVDETFKAYDLAFDPLRQLLFWTCENYNSINVTDSSGKTVGSVLSRTSVAASDDSSDEADVRPRLLALHPYHSHLYYSNDGKIERIKVDGMQRVVIVRGAHSIGGIAVDVQEGLLYWSDAGSRRLEMSDLDGRNRKMLLGGLDSPTSIAVMGRFVYWIEERGGVERVDKYTGEERYRALPRTEKANHIVFINDTASKLPFSNCDNRCTQLCVDSECSCFEGFVLSMEDRRTCGYRLPCGPHEFSCSRGKIGCIPLQLKCNGKSECADGSDELDCAEEFCEFHCPCEGACFKPTCLKKHEICDGKPDCPGSGYDESELACSVALNKDGNLNSAEPNRGHSPMTTVGMPIAIIVVVIVGAITWYCVKTRNNQFSSEGDACTDPLNAPGTNMTTIPTTETLHQFASTNGSSSIGSSPYGEPLVPHPSPATEVRSFCCHGNYAMYYKSVELAPPPTPCSTDVCDNSDIYAFAPPPSPHTSSPHSTIRSYPPYPPPPSPTCSNQ